MITTNIAALWVVIPFLVWLVGTGPYHAQRNRRTKRVLTSFAGVAPLAVSSVVGRGPTKGEA
jgi:hypothetical protein